MNIQAKTINSNLHRYKTCGDWWFNNDDLEVRVSDMNNWKYQLLIQVHEIIEAALCKDKGIKEEDVTAFDIEFEENRPDGNMDEPGNDPQAPYYTQHQYATIIEKDLARALGVDWETYDKFVNEFNG